jgi:hypothetical protein
VTSPTRATKGPLTRLSEYPWTVGYIAVVVTVILLLAFVR